MVIVTLEANYTSVNISNDKYCIHNTTGPIPAPDFLAIVTIEADCTSVSV